MTETKLQQTQLHAIDRLRQRHKNKDEATKSYINELLNDILRIHNGLEPLYINLQTVESDVKSMADSPKPIILNTILALITFILLMIGIVCDENGRSAYGIMACIYFGLLEIGRIINGCCVRGRIESSFPTIKLDDDD